MSSLDTAVSSNIFDFPIYVQVFALVGTIIIVKLALNVLQLFIYLLSPPKNLIQRWGKGWAVVTGSTDGIGKGFCFELASRGFDIALVARNTEKAQKVIEELQQKHPKVQYKIIKADFADGGNVELYNDIEEQLQKQDITNIACLVNNVGINKLWAFDEIDINELHQEITVNCFPIVLLTKKLLPKMLERQKEKKVRCGIINLASIMGEVPSGVSSTYCASKAFDDMFSRSLNQEYKDRLDILALKPLYVSTAMTGNIKKNAISPKECAVGCLNNVGYVESTQGHYMHRLQKWAIFTFNLQKMVQGMAKKVYLRNKRKQNQSKKNE